MPEQTGENETIQHFSLIKLTRVYFQKSSQVKLLQNTIHTHYYDSNKKTKKTGSVEGQRNRNP
jgi:hypothetical protein